MNKEEQYSRGFARRVDRKEKLNSEVERTRDVK